MPGALLLPVLTCAAVLLVSGVAKLRTPSDVDRAFAALGVPSVLDRPATRRALPWTEVALGVALLAVTGGWLTGVALVVLVLFAGYLVLVVRAERRPEPVDCGCFGALGAARVTRATVVRNALLVLAAALAVLAGLRGVGVRTALDADSLAWVLTAALTAAVAVALAWRPAGDAPDGTGDEAADEEYERRKIPEAQALTTGGELVLLRDEALAAAQLLVFLRPSCGACALVGPLLAGWREELAPVVVRAVLVADPDDVTDLPWVDTTAWFDPHGVAQRAFGVRSPSAVLLGTDGSLAGGPVNGADAVRELVEELREHLAGVSDDR